ncbi:Na+/H+ antiporter NhaA [Falsigemmobacter intermedius]|uniref:Na+/H+ antiporter NhaA n=1 Tax=Falsigemmobacter intermedius TaxID=1553448 RepID=UPI003F10431B
MYRIWNIITTYSLMLIGGAVIALIWANTAHDSYHHLVHLVLWDNAPIGAPNFSAEGVITHRTLTLHYLVNDLLMAFFFAIAAKEVWEAIILDEGSLRGKKALTPLIATAGGVLGPVAVYLALAAMMGAATFSAVAGGWAVPTATDIAFAYLVGRLVFGAGHPAVGFLLLLAIADDAVGLIILALFYPSAPLAPEWLLVSAGSALAVFVLANWLPRRLDRGNQARPNSTWVREKLSFWPYALAGAISWYAFQEAGIHPALGLLPVVVTIPHADRGFGIFAEDEAHQTDLLNTIEHGIKAPVQVVLFLFGLLNAGVEFSAIGSPTWIVLLALVIGKPLGITFFGWLAAVPMRLGLPEGMRLNDLPVMGFVAAIGFTVALFVASVAFDAEVMLGDIPVQAAAKMGALFSFGAAILALIAGPLFGVQKKH